MTAGAIFTVMTILVRLAAADLHPIQIVFFRNLLGLLFLLPWLTRTEYRFWRSPNLKLHLLRTCLWLGAMTCWFTGVTLIPLTDAVALNFTAPLFATVLAALILGEVVRIRRWTAVCTGLAGALIVLRPGFAEIGLGQLLILLDAMLWSSAMIVIRLLGRTESTTTIVSYMFILVAPISLIPALFVWQWPDLTTWLWLVGLAATSTVGHFLMTRAFVVAEASAIMPFDFVRLLWFALAGYLAFGEVPDHWTLVGAVVIVGSAIYIGQREAQLARAARRSARTGASPPPD